MAVSYGASSARERSAGLVTPPFDRDETPNAAKVLDKYWDGKLPVSPGKIAKAIGIKVQPGDHSMSESGVIQIIQGVPTITYNPNDAAVRRQFTLAHEIGHYVLGHLEGSKKMYRDPASNFSSRSASPEEREANQFAARLLMPANTLKYAVEKKHITSVSQLADLFEVSQVAMGYRLMNLGLANV